MSNGFKPPPLHAAQPRAAGPAQHPELAVEGAGRRAAARHRHVLQRHPALHARVEGLHVAQDLRPIEAPKGIDAARQLRRGATAPRHVQVGAGHPGAPEAVEALRVAERLEHAAETMQKDQFRALYSRFWPPYLVLRLQKT